MFPSAGHFSPQSDSSFCVSVCEVGSAGGFYRRRLHFNTFLSSLEALKSYHCPFLLSLLSTPPSVRPVKLGQTADAGTSVLLLCRGRTFRTGGRVKRSELRVATAQTLESESRLMINASTHMQAASPHH